MVMKKRYEGSIKWCGLNTERVAKTPSGPAASRAVPLGAPSKQC